ncbi:metal ABC transporter solute-binding protein, Zn/Mn family [Paenibacillus lentus]|uniref:ABC transporter substrate-binding protein n=1 Tax=Paenibacillus lentus TaxID=1338368 RepID=A0A3Q8S536_9BACL|nr:zinc ABC transporter substrate-binding protein [Paenibacillus lentus]AZK47041.1 ABC transporter substrate-binding protein [Paenibacillus lentus]
MASYMKIRMGWKFGVLLLAALLLLSGCGSSNSESKIVEGKVNVVTSFYPIYEFATEIGGEDANVLNLMPVGVEPHDWTPRSQEILNTSKAQLFFYNGAGLEGWIDSFLKGLGSDSKVKTVEVSQGIALIDSEEEDGHHHGEEGHDHGHNHGHDHGHIDPHTWVSPKSAMIMAENIKNSYIEVDPAHREQYEARYEQLNTRLQELDAKFTEELSKTNRKDIVVSHQSFGYLCRDYGLSQHSIMGLTPEAEPKAQDLVNLSKLVKERGIQYIFFEELVSDKLVNTLASEAGVKTLVLNPVEGLTKQQEQAGENYFTLMEKNLQNLVLALQ